jgi:hypothetical protein
VEAVVKNILSLGPTDKAIVFSQYTSMIDILEWRIKQEGVQVSRFQVNKVTHLYTLSNLCLLLCMLGSYLPDGEAHGLHAHQGAAERAHCLQDAAQHQGIACTVPTTRAARTKGFYYLFIYTHHFT